MRLLLTIVMLFLLSAHAFGMPSYNDMKAAYQSSDAVLLDRQGTVIHEQRINSHGRKLEWVKLGDISPALVKAVIRSEDKRFYEHHGADWMALLSAAARNLISSRSRGASTITMQLAALIDDHLKFGKSKRSVGQKWEQIKSAQAIEQSWTKDRILEAYLNLVSFRGELQGIAAASRGLFDKAPSGLDVIESVIVAALIRSPNAVPEKVGERAVQLAALLGGGIRPEAINRLAVDKLSRPYFVRQSIALAPHAMSRLIREGRTAVPSTLDARIQRFASETLQKQIAVLKERNVCDGAVLIVDNKTGDILAYVGNSGKYSSAPYVDGIMALRQAGSTLKPFLYAQAFEQRVLTAASLIDDAPLDVPTERGIYRPENYDKEYRGSVTARVALASSLNIPAVKTLALVGVDSFVQRIKSLEFSNLKDDKFYGLSLALGSADVELWELVNAYRTLANGGVWSELKLSSGTRHSVRNRIYSVEVAFLISDILSDREARSATFSLESPLATRFWTAVKTGTSKDMRDNWCVGYSDRYTVGIWVGNFSGVPMWNVSGMTGAAPVWLEIMNELHRENSSRPPVVPTRVVNHQVLLVNNGKAVKMHEWFIAGTEQDMVRAGKAEMRPRIIYPVAGMVIAVDPDIPNDLQKIFFEASSCESSYTMVLDGKVSGKALAWQPVPGVHELKIVERNGIIADLITFEVR